MSEIPFDVIPDEKKPEDQREEIDFEDYEEDDPE